MYSFTVTPVQDPVIHTAYFAEVKRINDDVTVAQTWRCTMEQAAEWAINTIKSFTPDDGLSNEELERQMTQLAGATRITTGNMT